MSGTKANITLSSVAEVKNGNLWLSLRKGLCELRRPGKGRRQSVPLPKGTFEKKLSLIICTAGVCPGLGDAVASAFFQTAKSEDYEVLVVWNKETPPPKESFPKKVRWVWEKRLGISHARNAGAEAAQGEILLYIDDDAVADANLVAHMLTAFRKHPTTAIVGGQIFLTLPNPRPEAVLPGREGLWSAYRVPYSGFRQVKEQYAFPYGACFAVGKRALQILGGFPTEYGRVGEDYGGGEETALCFMALQKGWKIGIQPKARVEHRVEPRRFSREHVQRTIRAGIVTTYRLCRDGYAPKGWDLRYVRDRLEIAEQELQRLRKTGTDWEQYYKECERDAFLEVAREMEGAI